MTLKNILLQIFFIIWQIPQCIIGLLMLPFLGKLHFIRYENYCWIFEGENMSGGISLGCFIFLSKALSNSEASIRHELGHTIQSHILGPLYLFTVGICSILNAMFIFTDCYYDFFPEKNANDLMGLKVKRAKYGCTLYIPEKKKEE